MKGLAAKFSSQVVLDCECGAAAVDRCVRPGSMFGFRTAATRRDTARCAVQDLGRGRSGIAWSFLESAGCMARW